MNELSLKRVIFHYEFPSTGSGTDSFDRLRNRLYRQVQGMRRLTSSGEATRNGLSEVKYQYFSMTDEIHLLLTGSE